MLSTYKYVWISDKLPAIRRMMAIHSYCSDSNIANIILPLVGPCLSLCARTNERTGSMRVHILWLSLKTWKWISEAISFMRMAVEKNSNNNNTNEKRKKLPGTMSFWLISFIYTHLTHSNEIMAVFLFCFFFSVFLSCACQCFAVVVRASQQHTHIPWLPTSVLTKQSMDEYQL